MRGITGGDDVYLAEDALSSVSGAIKRCLAKDGGPREVRKVARDTMLSILWERTKQRPMTVVNLIEVN